MAYNKLLSFINRIVPKKKQVSFSSYPDYSDNARSLYEWLQNSDYRGAFDDHKFIWHMDSMESMPLVYRDNALRKRSIASIWQFMRSDFIISTHGLYNAIKTSKKQKTILLWHGMPLKRIGYLYEEDVKNGVQEADYYTVTSVLFKNLFKQIFHADNEQILVTGQPRNDELFDNDPVITERISSLLGDKIILYMPTYRASNIRGTVDGEGLLQSDKVFGATVEHWEQISDELKTEGFTLVIKPHPMEAVEGVNLTNLSNIKVIDNNWLNEESITLYKLLARTNILITDYSSVYIDFLLLDRPIIFLVSDFDSYKQSRGFIFDNILDYLPGYIMREVTELPSLLRERDHYAEKRREINNLFNDIKTNNASEMVVKEVTRRVTHKLIDD